MADRAPLNDEYQADGSKPELWQIVQRDQCNGRTLECVNCGARLDEFHNILCNARAQAYKKARRGTR